MKKIVFVTGNIGKVKSAEKRLDNVKLEWYKFELIEPRSESVEEIAKYKVIEAYKEVKCPCIAQDSAFYIEALNGWPATFINFNLDKLGLDGFLKLMEGKDNRKAYFKQCLAYYDGTEIHYFDSISRGLLATKIRGDEVKEQWSSIWKIFIPDGYSKTLAELTTEERALREKNLISSFDKFNDWIKNQE